MEGEWPLFIFNGGEISLMPYLPPISPLQKKPCSLTLASDFRWNSDLFEILNFKNPSFGSKVMHFCYILSLKWPKSEKFLAFKIWKSTETPKKSLKLCKIQEIEIWIIVLKFFTIFKLFFYRFLIWSGPKPMSFIFI